MSKKILVNNSYEIVISDTDDGLVFPSGIYRIYSDGKRQYDLEHVVSKLFSIYGMSHELYDDLAAKLVVLRTLMHTLSVLAAAPADKDGIKNVVDVVVKETGLSDLLLAVYDEKPYIIYMPAQFDRSQVEDIIENNIFSSTRKITLDGYNVYPHTYTTDDGIFFIGFVTDTDIYVRVEPELLELLLCILIPFLRSVYLSEIAFYDALTGVLSRGKLMESLEMLWELAQYTDSRIAILMCDIDHFKRVNDTYGHDVGDIVLKEVAFRIKETSPKGSVVGRYGGEEFVVAFHTSGLSQAKVVAERIRLMVADKPVEYYDGTLPITVSIGGAIAYPAKENDTWHALLKRADENLYEAKREGRNRSIVK